MVLPLRTSDTNEMRSARRRNGRASMLFLTEQVSNGASRFRAIQRAYELLKTVGEKIPAQCPVAFDAWGNNVMLQQAAPALPNLFVHQSVNMMEMNGLIRLEELVGRMKKTRLIF